MNPSLRLRIALLSVLISGGVFLLFGCLTWYLFYLGKIEGLDTELRSLGARHPGWMSNPGNFGRFNSSIEFIFGEEHAGQILFMARDADGKILYKSEQWPDTLKQETIDGHLEDTPQQALTNMGRGHGYGQGRGTPLIFTKVPRFQTIKVGDSDWRLGIMGNDQLRLIIGLNCKSAYQDLARIRTVFLIVSPVAMLMIGLGGWIVASRALSPLKRVSDMAETLNVNNLHQRIPVKKETPEITRLIVVLNEMMTRIQSSFNQAVRFSADASHELKTPLAIMQGDVENALQCAEPGSPQQQVLNNLLEEIHRLKNITRCLLLLSQADAGHLPLAYKELNVYAELQPLLEDAEIMADDMALSFEIVIPQEIEVLADQVLLRMVLQNLMVNAIRYNTPKGMVRISALVENGMIKIQFSNTGPGIPEPNQAHVFDRFFRGDESRNRRKDGFGLGLSLSREIARAHGGELCLAYSTREMTRFILTLPAVKNCKQGNRADC